MFFYKQGPPQKSCVPGLDADGVSVFTCAGMMTIITTLPPACRLRGVAAGVVGGADTPTRLITTVMRITTTTTTVTITTTIEAATMIPTTLTTMGTP